MTRHTGIPRVVEQAERQNFKSWPKGMSWN